MRVCVGKEAGEKDTDTFLPRTKARHQYKEGVLYVCVKRVCFMCMGVFILEGAVF